MKMNIHLKKQLIRRVCALLIATVSIGLVYNVINPSGIPLRKVLNVSVVTERATLEKAIPNLTTSVYGHEMLSVSIIKADNESTIKRPVSSLSSLPKTHKRNVRGSYSNETISASIIPVNRREYIKNSANYNIAQITWREVKQLLEKEAIVLADGRLRQAFEAGHIPGAVSLPLATLAEEIGSFMNKFPAGTPIVVYCGNRRCAIAQKLSRFLVNHYGYSDVSIMPGGYLEWRQAEL